jgi:uncharacterized protein (TIGR03790 family)
MLITAAPAQIYLETDQLRDHLLVVYNKNDPDAESLARQYTEARRILPERVLALNCTTVEEIDRVTYEKTIRQPIEDYLIQQGWLTREDTTLTYGDKNISVQHAARNEIWSILLIRGIPLKIAQDPDLKEEPPAKQNSLINGNYASVDSELAALPIVGYPKTGPQPNAFFFTPKARNFDSLDAKNMILVARLDAPTAADVRRMIEDTLFAEKNRLAGRAYLDARGLQDPSSGYYIGDTWLRRAFVSLNRQGWIAELDDKGPVFSPNLPWSQVALYAGWYEGNATGPFMQRRIFQRGAIAYHIHSFSANTIRSTTANWVGPLLAQGAAATMGSVYEPVLELTPHLDVFFDRLLQGYSFVESAYASQKALSWTITIVGDPLYRPFQRSLPSAIATATDPFQRDWLRLQQARQQLQTGEVQSLPERLKTLVEDPAATAVAWEGYADLLRLPEVDPTNPQIPAAYQRAQIMSASAVDQVRLALKSAQYYVSVGLWQKAFGLIDKLVQRFPRESALGGVPETVQTWSRLGRCPPLPPRLQQLLPINTPVAP